MSLEPGILRGRIAIFPWPDRKGIVAVALGIAAFGVGCLFLAGGDALAQARHPFKVGISEGGGVPGSSLTRWILAQQVAFERLMSGTVRAITTDATALWTLIGIAFAYGVFHAAGPGHGKAVVASYMLANERALRRGLIISLLAAILQGLVAISIVGVLALVLNATAARMKAAAGIVEIASYLGVALLGLWLVWRKGRALAASLFGSGAAPQHAHTAHAHTTHDHAHHHHDQDHVHDHGHGHRHEHHSHDHPDHVHDAHCGHFHAPDPSTLGEGFTWKGAAATIVAAGLRPCSGAILVLVFALAQGIFYAGIAATVAMSLGTAMTTGALAAMAVLAKNFAVRYADGRGGSLALRAVPVLEFAAALFILMVGLLLFTGSLWRG